MRTVRCPGCNCVVEGRKKWCCDGCNPFIRPQKVCKPPATRKQCPKKPISVKVDERSDVDAHSRMRPMRWRTDPSWRNDDTGGSWDNVVRAYEDL